MVSQKYLRLQVFIFSAVIVMFLTACSHARYIEVPASSMLMPVMPPEPGPIVAASSILHPRKNMLIILDPGHGGKDLGTESAKPPLYQEKFLNLTTAYMLRNYLQQLGYSVQLTRNDDRFIALDKRAEFANSLSPRLFVSIHYNSAPSKDAEGIEVFYYRSKEDTGRSANSKKLAQTILKYAIKNTDAKSRGVKHGDLAVIRQTKMPAVLVEGGFLTNTNELTKLKDAVYLKKLAWGIAQGINEYIESPGTISAADKK